MKDQKKDKKKKTKTRTREEDKGQDTPLAVHPKIFQNFGCGTFDAPAEAKKKKLGKVAATRFRIWHFRQSG